MSRLYFVNLVTWHSDPLQREPRSFITLSTVLLLRASWIAIELTDCLCLNLKTLIKEFLTNDGGFYPLDMHWLYIECR